MAILQKELSREDVLSFISQSASFGNLGAFIGTGFSKAVLNDEFEDIALSWAELLRAAAENLNIDYSVVQKDGRSYPEVASNICASYAEKNNKTYSEAASKLKAQIADLTAWYPDNEKRDLFANYLEILSLAWIITTNYDLVIETLLPGRSESLGPNDPMIVDKSVIPVYHLHGVRFNPEEIIITQEDYVSLFRPYEYRQIKLALTISESTTLLIGYGLGDVNVLAALDWSKNVFSSETQNYPQGVIQILRKDDPINNPYRDRNGTVIIEVNSLESFFKEFKEVRDKTLIKQEEDKKGLEMVRRMLEGPSEDTINKFIDDKDFRLRVITSLSSRTLIIAFMVFLNNCIDATWRRAEPSGAFEGYKEHLDILLDILTSFDFNQIPSALFQTTAYSLERVGYYVDSKIGTSFVAHRLWENRKSELSIEMVNELKNLSDQHSYGQLHRLIKTIDID